MRIGQQIDRGIGRADMERAGMELANQRRHRLARESACASHSRRHKRA
jgi:hypothetical protein